jgi:hypothetical protein
MACHTTSILKYWDRYFSYFLIHKPSRKNTCLKTHPNSWWTVNFVPGKMSPACTTPCLSTWRYTQENFILATNVHTKLWMRGCSSATNCHTTPPVQRPPSANVVAHTNPAKLFLSTWSCKRCVLTFILHFNFFNIALRERARRAILTFQRFQQQKS